MVLSPIYKSTAGNPDDPVANRCVWVSPAYRPPRPPPIIEATNGYFFGRFTPYNAGSVIPINAVIEPEVAICLNFLSFVRRLTTSAEVAWAILEHTHPGPKMLSNPSSAICIAPRGPTAVCKPNITMIGSRPPTSTAGAQLALVLRKSNSIAR